MNRQTIPPLTPSAVEQLQTFIESDPALEPPIEEWELPLACDHTIRYQQRAILNAPDSPTWSCIDC